MNLESERLILRKFKKEDEDDCFEWLSHQETCYLDGGYQPWTTKDESFYMLMDRFSKQDGRLMIVLKEENKVIGTIYLRKALFRVVKAVEIGYVLSPNYRRCGYMKEALELIEALLKQHNVQLLLAKVYEHNIPSLSFVEKNGFIKEGRLVKSFKYPNREIGDLICFYKELSNG